MKKTVIYGVLLVLWCVTLLGCGNTFTGIKEDTEKNWDTVTGWSGKFKEKWW